MSNILQNNINKFKNLQCILFPGRGKRCIDKYSGLYNKTYVFWREMMKEAFVSENLHELANNLKSDDFIRHEEFICLFHNENPIGLLMFDWMNLTSLPVLEHSYFSRYPQDAIDKLKKSEHKLIMTIGHLTIHPGWRKSKIGPGISEILTGFMTRRFLESPATALLFLTRNTRSTHKLAFEHGGKKLVENYELYGLPADVIIFLRNDVRQCEIGSIAEITDYLWCKTEMAIINPLVKFYKFHPGNYKESRNG